MASIKKLLAAYIDDGEENQPGMPMTELPVYVWAHSDGSWEIEAEYKEGTNQGYFQVNYEFGPWTGRGATAKEAAENLLECVEKEYNDTIRQAVSSAIQETYGVTFGDLAADALRRLQTPRTDGNSIVIGGVEYSFDTQQELQDFIAAAKKFLANSARAGNSLAQYTDAQLIAELQVRGVMRTDDI